MAVWILFLEQEQLKEWNSYEELLGQNGKYNRLCQLQAKGHCKMLLYRVRLLSSQVDFVADDQANDVPALELVSGSPLLKPF